MPFSIKETNELYDYYGIKINELELIQSYMIFGGVPYYISLMDKRYSLIQNTEMLVFEEDGELFKELNSLYDSLFKKSKIHINIARTLAKSEQSLTREDISKKALIGSGKPLSNALRELEECGFIRKYNNITTTKNNAFYQLIDPFSLFSFKFVESGKITSWIKYSNSPSYYSWQGHAFEVVCFHHIEEIKRLLKVEGIEANIYSWRSKINNHL